MKHLGVPNTPTNQPPVRPPVSPPGKPPVKPPVTPPVTPPEVPDWETAMKHVVREDPDVIFVGEMRDKDTFQPALQAADRGPGMRPARIGIQIMDSTLDGGSLSPQISATSINHRLNGIHPVLLRTQTPYQGKIRHRPRRIQLEPATPFENERHWNQAQRTAEEGQHSAGVGRNDQ